MNNTINTFGLQTGGRNALFPHKKVTSPWKPPVLWSPKWARHGTYSHSINRCCKGEICPLSFTGDFFYVWNLPSMVAGKCTFYLVWRLWMHNRQCVKLLSNYVLLPMKHWNIISLNDYNLELDKCSGNFTHWNMKNVSFIMKNHCNFLAFLLCECHPCNLGW